MTTFFLFGRYSAAAVKDISAARTKKAQSIITKLGGKVISIYALMGKEDLALIVEMPGIEEAMKASISLSRATGISFITSPAVSVEEFDRLTATL